MSLKKNIIFIILLFSYTIAFSQTIVEYVSKNDFTGQTYDSYLFINNYNSIFINVFHKRYLGYEELLNDNDFINNKRYISSLRYSIDENRYYGTVSFDKKIYVYSDISKVSWKLTTEKNIILGYQCKLAYSDYRGRKYKVWYTTEIPIIFGPWKLGNLPGLILKAEIDNKFSFEAKRIVFNKKFEIPQRYYDMYNYTIGIPLDFKNFISIENQYFEDIRNKQITNLPKGVVLDYIPSIRENMIEKSFEWEETKKP